MRDGLPKHPTPQGSSAAPAGIDLLILAIALFVALLDLGTRTLHELDTPRWGLLAREMLRTGEWLVPTRYGDIYANKPPLYLWSVAGLGSLTGELSPCVVRLPAALGFVLLVLSSTWWATWRLGTRSAGRITGLLLLSSFGMMWLAREGRLDMFGAGLAVWGTATLDRAASTGSKRSAILAGLALGLTALVKGPPHWLGAIAVFLVGGSDPLPQRWRRLPARWVFAGMAGIPLLWLLPAALQGGEPYWRALVVDQMGDRLAGTGNHQQPPWHYATVGSVHFAPWGPAFVAVACMGLVPALRSRLPSLRGLATAGGLVLLIFSLVPTKHVRYLAPVLPLLALPLAGCVLAWWQRPTGTRWVLHRRAAGAGLLALAAGIVVLGLRFDVSNAPLPWWLLAGSCIGAGLGVLAITAASDPSTERRRWTIAALVLAVAAVLTVGVFRYRLRIRDNETFNRAIAARVQPDAPFFALAPNTPEDVFHGAPQATLARGVEAIRTDTPRPFYVLFRPHHRDPLKARFGTGTQVVGPEDGPTYFVVRYGALDKRPR